MMYSNVTLSRYGIEVVHVDLADICYQKSECSG